MKMREKPLLTQLFFEKFFLELSPFDLNKWKKFDDSALSVVQKSIAENAYYILNTTNSLKVDDYLKKKLTFLDFGVPDFMTLYSGNNISTKKIGDCVKHALESFEPRLLEIEVKISNEDKSAIITVHGKIKKTDPSFFNVAYCNLKK